MMFNVDCSKIYCDKCCKIKRKESNKKYHLNNPKIKYSLEELKENFLNTTDKSFKLTIKGFNKFSKIKAQSYTSYFNLSWHEIIKNYGKLDVLYDYIIKEFKKYYEKTGLQGMKEFANKHEYINYNTIKYFSTKQIDENCGFNYLRYTKEELIENFNKITYEIGHIPLCGEFFKVSKISVHTYKDCFNLHNIKMHTILWLKF